MQKISKSTPRPAIPNDPLPQAGESLFEQLLDQLILGATFWSISAVLAGAAVLNVWVHYLFPHQPSFALTLSITILCAIFIVIASIKARRAFRKAGILRQGIRGERHVAQYLEKHCRALGYEIFHDVPANGSSGDFNIDHVLIGPGGVFSLETKNWTLPHKGNVAKVRFDPQSDRLLKPDGTFDTTAPVQARNNARFLRELLTQRTASTPDSLSVRPVLLLPGWYIHNTQPFQDLWVLGNNSLHKWLPRERVRLTPPEIARLAAALTDYIRNFRK